MPQITIDADALFRAVTATGFKLLAYELNIITGEIHSRTLQPDEVAAAPQGPSVKPLPKMGGDLAPRKDASPFGPPPVSEKKKLFVDDDLPRKPAFESEFFKREDQKKPDLFGDGGFKRESGSKKLAEIFGGPPPRKKADPFARAEEKPVQAPAASQPVAPTAQPVNAAQHSENTGLRRIPAATDAEQLEWMTHFARDCGDPQIRELLQTALKDSKAPVAFERALRKYQRTAQQWERYHRKQALAYAEAWLSDLGLQWELLESSSK